MRRQSGMWAFAAAALPVGGELASAQTQDIVPTLKWTVRGRYPDFPGANANDEGSCIGYFNEDPQGLNKH